jgi:hypothetical protein
MAFIGVASGYSPSKELKSCGAFTVIKKVSDIMKVLG